jgi:hypothetical protein
VTALGEIGPNGKDTLAYWLRETQIINTRTLTARQNFEKTKMMNNNQQATRRSNSNKQQKRKGQKRRTETASPIDKSIPQPFL